MTPSITSATPDAPSARKPRDDELDVFGLTHQGKVRRDNQDHFLFCTLHKTMRVRFTSLPTPELLEIPTERLASLFMVADGVGSSEGGGAASRMTVETMAAYATHTMQCYYHTDAVGDSAFFKSLEEAAHGCHEAVLAHAGERPDIRRMATTLTLGMAVWPKLYLLHIGDSRCYHFRQGELTCLTKDQTMAQALVDSGVLKPEDIPRSPFRNVLSSAIGGTTHPEVSQHLLQHGDLVMLCTDGLTKHVSDDQIRERFRTMTSSEQVARRLVDDALEGGGTDNVTVLVARTALKS